MMRDVRKFIVFLPVALAIFLAQGASAQQESEDPPARVGRLSTLSGQVSLEPSGVTQWSAASPNYPVATGDRLYADQDGQVEIQVGEIVARLWHSTDLSLTNVSDQLVQLGLAQGTLRLRSEGLQADEDLEVDTPNGAVTVIRAGDIRIDAYPGDAGTVVTVNSGQVQVTGPNFSQYVNAGQSIRLVGSNPIYATYIGMAGMDEFDSWSASRDRRLSTSASAQYVGRDVPGYDDLDANGDWDATSDYGPVWYPRSVPADWVPYRYGHWVWTGPWGWTWVEDESWGYAPFHYGRWVNLRNRWGWVPGPVVRRPVWSPALVAFVGGPHFSVGVAVGGGPGVSAWFPLGPGEPYSPWYRCSPRYVNRVNITNIRVTRVVVAQNNYTGIDVNNVHYNYRSTAVTAVRADAFAGARPVHQNLVRVDPNQMRQVQVLAKPEIRPTVTSMVAHPVNRVPVSTMHPVLLTHGGQQMMASPGARPEPVPVRPIAPSARGTISNPRSTMVPAPAAVGRQVRPGAESQNPAPPVQNTMRKPGYQISTPMPAQEQPRTSNQGQQPGAATQERTNQPSFSRPDSSRQGYSPRNDQQESRPQSTIRPPQRQEERSSPQTQQPQTRPTEQRAQPQPQSQPHPTSTRQETSKPHSEEKKHEEPHK